MTTITGKVSRRVSAAKVIVLMALILIPGFFALNAFTDIDADHAKSPTRQSQCYAISEHYYSRTRGTSLELCNAGDGLWQGRVCRLTALDGSVILSIDEAYECTILTTKRSYWDGVIIRDGYGPFPPELDKALDSIPIGE